MPVRSLSSSVLRWPDRSTVEDAFAAWAVGVGRRDPRVRRVGHFGSYARGDWGVGSDLDIVVVVDRVGTPFEKRAVAFDASALPVPADVLVYSVDEWERLGDEGGFVATIAREVRWAYDADVHE